MVCWVEEQVCASASNMLQPTAVLVLALILHLHSESPKGCWAAVWLTWISKVCVGLTMTLRMIGEIWSTSFPGPVHIDQCVLAWQVSQKTAYKTFFFILKWTKRSEAKLIEGLYKHGSQSVLQLRSGLNPFWQLLTASVVPGGAATESSGSSLAQAWRGRRESGIQCAAFLSVTSNNCS